MLRKVLLLLAITASSSLSIFSQNNDSAIVAKIFARAMASNDGYSDLKMLCEEAPGRLIGSEASETAIRIIRKRMEEINHAQVYLQRFEAPAWEITKPASLRIVSGKKSIALHIAPLGPSAATPVNGIRTNVIEAASISDLLKIPPEKVKGKIVFLNTEMNDSLYFPSEAYGQAVKSRVYGASNAAKMGALAVIVRSMTHSIDTVPHTGSVVYDPEVKKIPATAISTFDADLLSKTLKKDPDTGVELNIFSEYYPKISTANLIAEIPGNEFPNEVIIMAAQLDTWYTSPGAHDDGAGCVQVIDALRAFSELNIQNKRTIRVICFMDEEMFQSGGDAYAGVLADNDEKIVFGMESDFGGFSPDGFRVDGSNDIFNKISDYAKIMQPYDLNEVIKGWGGVDLHHAKQKKYFPTGSLKLNNQRYFDYVHSPHDSIDKINRRELHSGAAAITALIYMIDKYGL